MLEIFFYFFVLLSLLVFGFGIQKHSPSFVGLAAVLFIVLGSLFLAGETFDRMNGYTITEVSSTVDAIDFNYSYYTVYDIDCPSNQYCEESHFVHVFATLFFYGGFAVIALAFLMYLYKAKMRRVEFEEA